MKRTPWLLASSFGLLGLACVPLACVSNANPPAQPEVDSGLFGEDAALPGPDATTGDSGAVDGGADTAVADAAVADAADAGPQPLTLTVLLAGSPESGVTIVFQDDTGAVVSTSTTDASGTVSQLVVAGSQVTVLLGPPSAPSPLTIQGIAPGDVLTVVDSTPSATPPPSESVAVTLPAPTWDASGGNEVAYAGSCNTNPPYALYLGPECQAQGEFPIFARALDSTGVEIAYTYQTGNEVTPDGGIPDGDDGVLPIVVTRPWSTSAATQTITATNIQPPPADAGPGGANENVTLSYGEYAGGVALWGQGGVSTTDDAGDESQTFEIHPGYPDFVQLEGYSLVGINYDNVESIVAGATRIAPPTTSQPPVPFDLSTLPMITAASVESADGGTSSQPTVIWSSAGSLSVATGIFVQIQWSAPPPDGGEYSINGTWTILAPATATSVTAPALPSSMATWAPSAEAYVSMPRVGAVQASFLAGYAALRAAFGTLSFFPGQNWQLTVPPLPVNGTLYVTGIYPNEG